MNLLQNGPPAEALLHRNPSIQTLPEYGQGRAMFLKSLHFRARLGIDFLLTSRARLCQFPLWDDRDIRAPILRGISP